MTNKSNYSKSFLQRVSGVDRDYVYMTTENEDDYAKVLIEIILHEGYSLWEIGASYAKHLPKVRYYIVARTAKEAKDKFSDAFIWMSFVDKPVKCSPEKEYEILHDPKRVSSI